MADERPESSQGRAGDDPDEVFDLVDERDRVIGRVRRGEAHRDPRLIHRSVQVLIFDSQGRLLLQRRSQAKDLFPGYHCASASGHVAAGDDYVATAARELREELGVSLPVTLVGKTLVRSAFETEIMEVYSAQSDGPFHFHPTETNGGEFVTPAALAEGRATGALRLTPALEAALQTLARVRPGDGSPWRAGFDPPTDPGV